MRLTIAVPAAHVDDANDLAMVLGYGPADAQTYRTPAWKDAAGNLYSAASLEVVAAFLTSAVSSLSRPAWDEAPYTVNMAGAARAQALIVVWAGEGPVPQASPNAITAVAGPPGRDAIIMLGLTPKEVVDEEA